MKIIFTNGCFDIIHYGHVRLLEYCHDLAHKTTGGPGKVIVGLNSDESITELKGPSRPINTEQDRIYILESLRWVDDVITFNEQTPYNLIKQIKPDIIVKGGDYDISVTEKTHPKYIVGSDISTVKVFNTIEGYSTTNIIKEIDLLK
jgi:D-beta-D-heptose 7-phosphate kinase/D-beta-D-heptose 1-phosphate adenosyltransferase